MKAPYAEVIGLTKGLAKIYNAYSSVDTVMDQTLKDMISRAPGKIASAVTWMYGVKKSEIRYKKGFEKKSIGTIKLQGADLSSAEFIYQGRVLTPLHFSMTPKERPKDKKKYKIYAKIKKRRKAFSIVPTASASNGIFLAPASKSSTVIPWFRYSEDKFDIAPIKTLSLPQMVDNKLVKKQIYKDVGELFHKRLDHHLARHLKKAL